MADDLLYGGYRGPGGFMPPSGPVAAGTLVAGVHEDAARSTVLNAVGSVIIYEETVDLSQVPFGTMLLLRLSCILRVSNPAAATIGAILGAVAPGDTAGGVLRASINDGPVVDTEETALSVAFANPANNNALLQIVALCNPNTEIAFVRGLDVEITVQ